MSHSGWLVIPLVLNRRGGNKNKAAAKTSKTSVGQPRQGRSYMKRTQIQPNSWLVSPDTPSHRHSHNPAAHSHTHTHLHAHIRASAVQLQGTGSQGYVFKCVFGNSWATESGSWAFSGQFHQLCLCLNLVIKNANHASMWDTDMWPRIRVMANTFRDRILKNFIHPSSLKSP